MSRPEQIQITRPVSPYGHSAKAVIRAIAPTRKIRQKTMISKTFSKLFTVFLFACCFCFIVSAISYITVTVLLLGICYSLIRTIGTIPVLTTVGQIVYTGTSFSMKTLGALIFLPIFYHCRANFIFSLYGLALLSVFYVTCLFVFRKVVPPILSFRFTPVEDRGSAESYLAMRGSFAGLHRTSVGVKLLAFHYFPLWASRFFWFARESASLRTAGDRLAFVIVARLYESFLRMWFFTSTCHAGQTESYRLNQFLSAEKNRRTGPQRDSPAFTKQTHCDFPGSILVV